MGDSSLESQVELTDKFHFKMASGEAKIGSQAPNFSTTAVVDGEFKENFTLDQYKGKYVVLFFYPLDFTFVCPTEICAFSDRAHEFAERNCQVLACSTDSHFSHFAWTMQSRKEGGIGEMKIPLLADTNHAIGKKYGVMVPDAGITYRGLFIIDDQHNVRQITINDLPVGRNVDEVLRLVDAFQFVAEHGEVCPAGWQKGSKTIKPGVKDSKEYFNAAN